jgi:beta-carotene hydroxylase
VSGGASAPAEVALRGSEALDLRPAPTLEPSERKLLLREEKAIAAKYMGGRMWIYPVFALGGFALWAALFPLAMAGIIPLWLGFIVSCVLGTGGYVT